MDIQSRILLSYVLLSLAIIAVFVFIALRSKGPIMRQDDVQGPGYVIRRWWFFLLLSVLALAFGVSIPFYPYGKAQANSDAVEYSVIAQQFAFVNLPLKVPLNTPIIFNVTSSDVTHGFAIYNAKGRLIDQVQAMPEYDNQLAITFTEPGKYQVRCLEYCGLGHHVMEGSFEVK